MPINNPTDARGVLPWAYPPFLALSWGVTHELVDYPSDGHYSRVNDLFCGVFVYSTRFTHWVPLGLASYSGCTTCTARQLGVQHAPISAETGRSVFFGKGKHVRLILSCLAKVTIAAEVMLFELRAAG